MQSQLTANATPAGALLASARFLIPEYQREYAWQKDEYEEFWNDLSNSLDDDSYFLGLVILTAEDERMHVVDGQQRLLTVLLLAAAIKQEALTHNRSGLADQVDTTFLRALDYESDTYVPRITLSDPDDDRTLRDILDLGPGDPAIVNAPEEDDPTSVRMSDAYNYLQTELHADLASDPFRRLSLWTQFLTDRLYFAVFVHPDAGAAYRVFEVINTRGRELTTADLLKNYLLSKTDLPDRRSQYERWKAIGRRFSSSPPNTLVLFIRHVVSTKVGYVLPKDLYDFVSQRRTRTNSPDIARLLDLMESWLPIYLQMIDPASEGPAGSYQLRLFETMNELGITAVRPLLMAMSELPDSDDAMAHVLRTIVHRSVVGNIGTSGAERRFSDAAKSIADGEDWTTAVLKHLQALDASKEEFESQLHKRSLNKSTLQFVRRSIVQSTITPTQDGHLHFIRPRTATNWAGFDDDEAVAFWASTIGNTMLSQDFQRAPDTTSWAGVCSRLLTTAVQGEVVSKLSSRAEWTPDDVSEIGVELSVMASDVWY